MARRKTQQRPMHLFTVPGQVTNMILADGFRFMILVRGEPPTMVPITESGSYEIDIPAVLAKGKYPIGLVTVDCADVPAFEKIPVAVVGRLLDAAAAHAKGGQP